MSDDTGVYYDRKDTAGLIKRLSIQAIDISFLIFVLVICYDIKEYIYYETEYSYEFIFPSYCIFTLIYLTIVKPSKIGTLGLLVCNSRIVTIKGGKPSLFQMLARLGLLIIGPLNILLDIFWLTMNKEKRTIRDCLSETYVIKKSAEPLGEGNIITERIFSSFITLMYSKVSRNEK